MSLGAEHDGLQPRKGEWRRADRGTCVEERGLLEGVPGNRHASHSWKGEKGSPPFSCLQNTVLEVHHEKDLIVALAAVRRAGRFAADPARLRLATTTSTQDSGLLPVLNPPFEKLTGITVDVIAVGTGKAIKLGQNGDVDVVLVHDRKAEDKFVAQGFGVNRRDVMHNDFVIVGPAEDPAKVAAATSAADAFARIAAAGAPFVSRGDTSGTNAKELDLWATVGRQAHGEVVQGGRPGHGRGAHHVHRPEGLHPRGPRHLDRDEGQAARPSASSPRATRPCSTPTA